MISAQQAAKIAIAISFVSILVSMFGETYITLWGFIIPISIIGIYFMFLGLYDPESKIDDNTPIRYKLRLDNKCYIEYKMFGLWFKYDSNSMKSLDDAEKEIYHKIKRNKQEKLDKRNSSIVRIVNRKDIE